MPERVPAVLNGVSPADQIGTPPRYAAAMGCRSAIGVVSAEDATAVRKAASGVGMSLSGWVERTVGSIARRKAGVRSMHDYEAEQGAFTPEELEQARQTLRQLGLLEGAWSAECPGPAI